MNKMTATCKPLDLSLVHGSEFVGVSRSSAGLSRDSLIKPLLQMDDGLDKPPITDPFQSPSEALLSTCFSFPPTVNQPLEPTAPGGFVFRWHVPLCQQFSLCHLLSEIWMWRRCPQCWCDEYMSSHWKCWSHNWDKCIPSSSSLLHPHLHPLTFHPSLSIATKKMDERDEDKSEEGREDSKKFFSSFPTPCPWAVMSRMLAVSEALVTVVNCQLIGFR